jgi:transposase-like protein
LAVRSSNDPQDYARLGLARKEIKPWEDGARTDDRPGSYEWWYFDAHLVDGTKLVVVLGGLTTEERARLKELERENRELRRANEILKSAAVFFGAELDRRSPR